MAFTKKPIVIVQVSVLHQTITNKTLYYKSKVEEDFLKTLNVKSWNHFRLLVGHRSIPRLPPRRRKRTKVYIFHLELIFGCIFCAIFIANIVWQRSDGQESFRTRNGAFLMSFMAAWNGTLLQLIFSPNFAAILRCWDIQNLSKLACLGQSSF